MSNPTTPEPPKSFALWWRAHRDHKHGIPARVAYKCQCYLDEYKAASVLAPLLQTTEPGAGAMPKVVRTPRVNEHNNW
jgi:hypothetical protein